VLAVDTTPLRRPRRLPAFLGIALVTSVVGAAGMLVAARGVVDEVPRVPGVSQVLSNTSTNVENYLLVGSDSRELGDPNTGETGGVTGNRSDTMMVLRIDKNDDSASLLSIPRDLYVDTPDHTGRINGAYNDGPAALVVAIQQALSLPIHHYVEIDFSGFKALVEALDGWTEHDILEDLDPGKSLVAIRIWGYQSKATGPDISAFDDFEVCAGR